MIIASNSLCTTSRPKRRHRSTDLGVFECQLFELIFLFAPKSAKITARFHQFFLLVAFAICTRRSPKVNPAYAIPRTAGRVFSYPAMKYSLDTELVNVETRDEHHAAAAPVYLSATFHQTSLTDMNDYDYTRSGNPTRTTLEHHLAKIMGEAKRAFAVHSGMGALDVLSRLLRNGDEIIAGSDLYGGSSRLLTFLRTQQGILTHHVNTSDVDAVIAQVSEKTRIVLLESPTNPQFQICDIPTVARAVKAKSKRAIIVVDNTMMSPINANPFELGADVWYESATKYLSGHHDIMAGAIAINDPELIDQVKFVINANGAGLAPFDSWLLLRGVKTLGVRFEKQQANAIKVAAFLKELGPQLKVPKFELFFPGDPDLKNFAVHQRTTHGPGSVLAIRTHDVALSEKIVESTQIYRISVSFGTVNSLISLPCKMSHASIDAKTRAERGFPEDIIRLCMGIESAEDLIEDLRAAFKAAGVL